MPKLTGEIADELEMRLRDGEKLDMDDLVHKYYPNIDPIIGKYKIHSRLSTVRSRLASEGIPVALIGRGIIGIPENKADYTFAHQHTVRRIRGMFSHATVLFRYGEEKNLLPEGLKHEVLKLPSLSLTNSK